MIAPKDLARKIRSIGFQCTACGTCCRSGAGDSGLVLVSSREVRTIMAATGMHWEEIAAPYPEMIDDRQGGRYTLGWCIRRNGDACRFLSQGRCAVYAGRPWICRTYPFMLEGNELAVSACTGLGQPISAAAALQLARNLIARQCAEENDEEQIRKILLKNPLPAGSTVVIDSEGVKPVHG